MTWTLADRTVVVRRIAVVWTVDGTEAVELFPEDRRGAIGAAEKAERCLARGFPCRIARGSATWSERRVFVEDVSGKQVDSNAAGETRETR